MQICNAGTAKHCNTILTNIFFVLDKLICTYMFIFTVGEIPHSYRLKTKYFKQIIDGRKFYRRSFVR